MAPQFVLLTRLSLARSFACRLRTVQNADLQKRIGVERHVWEPISRAEPRRTRGRKMTSTPRSPDLPIELRKTDAELTVFLSPSDRDFACAPVPHSAPHLIGQQIKPPGDISTRSLGPGCRGLEWKAMDAGSILVGKDRINTKSPSMYHTGTAQPIAHNLPKRGCAENERTLGGRYRP